MDSLSRRKFIKAVSIAGVLLPFANAAGAVNMPEAPQDKNCLFISSTEKDEYLAPKKAELVKEWPNNRTINLIFHGHSVPSGYFVTPDVRPLQSYPFLLLKELKKNYPFAVVNIILTCIGGENSEQGAKRFKKQVLNHKPDVLFIDYALNDTGIGAEASRKSWEYMIKEALKRNIKVILLTATPDQRVDLLNKETDLQKICNQVVELSKEYKIGLIDNYTLFQKLVASGENVTDYMSQVNHPNEKGHQLVVDGMMKYF
jgi:acyl-CoA thioesterase I